MTREEKKELYFSLKEEYEKELEFLCYELRIPLEKGKKHGLKRLTENRLKILTDHQIYLDTAFLKDPPLYKDIDHVIEGYAMRDYHWYFDKKLKELEK